MHRTRPTLVLPLGFSEVLAVTLLTSLLQCHFSTRENQDESTRSRQHRIPGAALCADEEPKSRYVPPY